MLKDSIFAAVDIKTREVKVEEWGVSLFVSSMSGVDRAKFNSLTDTLTKEGKESEGDTWLVILTACDDKGNKVFDASDFDRLNSKSAAVITKIAKEALIVNGLLPESVSEAKKN